MRPRLAAELEVGQERAFSLTSLARLSDQASQLEQKLVNTGAGSSIVIGHSQGGLIARKLGQRRNDLVDGVITIGSPHAGALIADLAPGEASMDVHSAMGAYCFGNFMCGLTNNLSAGVDDGRVSYGLTVTVPPVVQDVRTNSAFLDTLNTSYEPFMRASIQVDAGNRWAAMRLVGDLLSERERLLDGHAPKGRDWVADTEDLYRGAIAFMSLAMFIKWYVAPSVGCGHSGYIHYWPPCYDAHYGNYWYESSYWNQLADILFNVGFIVATALNAVDQTWDFLTTRHSDLTDGFIQYSSQRYPAVPGIMTPLRLIVREGDSHTGETASPPVLVRIQQALVAMDVPER